MSSRFRLIPAVYILFRKDGKVLLLRRENTGYHDGDYSLIAGHVDGGESLKSAAIREAKEEVGVVVKREDLQLVHVLHRRSDKNDNSNERIDFFFDCNVWEGLIQNMEPEKCSNLMWCCIDSLPSNTVPYLKSTIDNIQEENNYSHSGWKE